MSAPILSVVVATRDRPAALERCVAALAGQTARPLEIVVVDDGSRDPAAVADALSRGLRAGGGEGQPAPQACIVAGGGRGPAAARNAGARSAHGTVICFTDDDCVPDRQWAQRLASACFEGGAAAGTTVADPAAGRCAAASQLLTHTLQLASLRAGSRELGFAPTCNLACHEDVARTLPFDEAFELAAGEDRDWCSRLAAAGVALRFVPDATVAHHPRLGLLGLLRQQARYGRGAVGFRAAAADGRRLSGRAFYGRLARACAHAGPRVCALVVLAQAAVAAGGLRETLARSRSRR